MDQTGNKIPNIGICIAQSRKILQKQMRSNTSMFKQVNIRLTKYPYDNASFIIFTLDDLDLQQRNVKGYRYEGEESWTYGVYPFPDAIYLRCGINIRILNQVEQIIGRKVFNSSFPDKLDFWNFLSRNALLRDYLPETSEIENNDTLKQYLDLYRDVFLKPVKGFGGMGIIRASLQKGGTIKINYQIVRERYTKEFDSLQELQKWIPSLSKDTYIVQQTINTVKWKGRPTDIRLNMNKNGNGQWEPTALFSRYALKGSHVGSGRGILYKPLEITQLLQRIFPENEEKLEEMRESIIDLGLKVCSTLDESVHHMADLGIDIGLDEKGRLWIFEVNPLPHPFGPPLQDLSNSRPLEYAVYLASQ